MVSASSLQDLAHLLRRDVLTMTTRAGSGHPTSCLSCAEIIATLFATMRYAPHDAHYPENDEFILSKGHAAPILYAVLKRAGCITNNLSTFRQHNSALTGHPLPTLPWIKTATGSLGQGLSIGIGMALAARIQKRSSRTYVLLGDSESSEGQIYEAAQLAAHYKLNTLCAILDANRLGQSNETMYGHTIRKYKKLFSALGWKTILVNGHNIHQLLRAYQRAANERARPTIIIAKTIKGKGVPFLADKEGWHGKALTPEQLEQALTALPNLKPVTFSIEKPLIPRYQPSSHALPALQPHTYTLGDLVATREAYGFALTKLAQHDPLLIATDAEVKNSTFAQDLANAKPEHFIEAYIAEQNMISMALGMSVKGQHVYTSTFSAFFTRAHDQLRMAALSKATFTCVGSHCGTSIGQDGPSQMGLDDIALFRSLPNSTVLYPADAVATEHLLLTTHLRPGIKYIRTTRPKTPIIYPNTETFPIGDFKIVKKEKKAKAVIAAAGITLHEALKAHAHLKKQGISVTVIDCYSIKPFTATKKLLALLKQSNNTLLILEDHYAEGGLGEMLTHALAGHPAHIIHNTITSIPPSGPWPDLAEKYNITESGIVHTVKTIKHFTSF